MDKDKDIFDLLNNIQEEDENIEESMEEVNLENIGFDGDAIEVNSQNDLGMHQNSRTESFDVFSGVEGISSRAVGEDPRIPTTAINALGSITQFEQSVGGVDFIFDPGAATVSEKYKFQGTAKASLIFSGSDFLSATATISSINSLTTTGVTFSGVESVTLRSVLVDAANEKIDDINGLTTNGIVDIRDRTKLVLALSSIFSANNATDFGTPLASVPPLTLTFKDLDDSVPKQVTLDFKSDVVFNLGEDTVRNIINEDSFIDNLSKKPVGFSRTSDVNLDAEGIAINIGFKSDLPEKGLKTNTNYEFIAPNKDMLFYKDGNTAVTYYLEGLDMNNFKTSKRLAVVETLAATNTGLIETTEGLITVDTQLNLVEDDRDLDYYSIANDDLCYVDFNQVVSTVSVVEDFSLDLTGTTIKFNTLKFYDEDQTITKIEVEDDRADKYTATLIPVDSKKLSDGANLQISGLERSTPYVFRKIHIQAKPGEDVINKIIGIGQLSGTGVDRKIGKNTIAIRTESFMEPTLYIEKKEIYVSVDGLIVDSTASGAQLVHVPVDFVELPNGIKMEPVKNDATALRYVVKVENPDGLIGDLAVNGLRGDEEAIIERYEDSKEKMNYYVVTLRKLIESRDYGFIILETAFKDPDGRELIARQHLREINGIKSIGGVQFPGVKIDNTTQDTSLTGLEAFNVTIFNESIYVESRKADAPVFIDDIQGKFVRMEFDIHQENPNATVELVDSELKFTGLLPDSDLVYKVKFYYEGNSGKEEFIAKYVKIKTPKISALDVKAFVITPAKTTADVKLDLHSELNVQISSVKVKDDDTIKATWDKDTNTVKLENLKQDTKYADLELEFRLSNGRGVTYRLNDFSTTLNDESGMSEHEKFVARVYEIALGREPESDGLNFWVEKLSSGELTTTDFISYNLMTQPEFVEKDLNKEEFVKMMYKLIVNRDPDEEGLSYWIVKYDEYTPLTESITELRVRIAREMMDQDEFKNLVGKLRLRY